MMALYLSITAVLMVLFARCPSGESITSNATDTEPVLQSAMAMGHPVCSSESCKKTADKILSAINSSADPCDDFFSYACGGWIEAHEIPSNESQIDQFWLMNQSMKLSRQYLLEGNYPNRSEFASAKKARELYQQCKKRSEMEKLGGKPLLKLFDTILGGWPILTPDWPTDQFDLYKALATLRPLGVTAFLDIEVTQRMDDPKANILMVDEGSYPGSKDILQSSSRDKYLESYFAYMKNVTRLLLRDKGDNDRNTTEMLPDLQKILDMENNLTMATLSSEQGRDVLRCNNTIRFGAFKTELNFQSEFMKNMTSFMQTMFAPVNQSDLITDDLEILNAGPAYTSALDGQLHILEQAGSDGKRQVANFIGWRMIEAYGMDLSKDYRDALKGFQKAMYGQKVQQNPTTEERCADDVTDKLPLVISAMYVRDLVSPKLRDTASMMTSDIKDGIHDLLQEAVWMDGNTTEFALSKLNATLTTIAYPMLFLNNISALDDDMEDVKIEKTYFESLRSLDKRANFKNFRKLLKRNKRIDPINDPQDYTQINAYNVLEKNTVIETVGILQLPFFDENSPQFANYGGIGFVLGHEFTHAFDDQGSYFDQEGRMQRWWSKETRDFFNQRKLTLVNQYGNYSFEGIGKVNGNLTIGENIADNGGLKAAFKGFTKYLSRAQHNTLKLEGLQNFTDEQLFFITAGQIWCGSVRPEALKLSLLENVHSPLKYRVNGPMSNMPEFSNAFKCSDGSRMNPTKKNGVW